MSEWLPQDPEEPAKKLSAREKVSDVAVCVVSKFNSMFGPLQPAVIDLRP